MPKKIFIPPGTRFARLVVLKESEPYHTKSGTAILRSICQCDCGNIIAIRNRYLRTGRSRSCGCLRKESARAALTTHGHSKTLTYDIWCRMKARCTSQTDRHYDMYGGRGITVCERWMTFENFLADMGEAPHKLSIGRIDNNKGYSPDNCRWETQTQQMRNTRRNKVLTVGSITAPMSALCEHFKISRAVVRTRLKLGWPIEAAFLLPRHSKNPKTHSAIQCEPEQ